MFYFTAIFFFCSSFIFPWPPLLSLFPTCVNWFCLFLHEQEMGWGHIDLFSEQSTGVQVCIRCVMHTDTHSCYLSLLLWVRQTCNQSILKHNSSNYCCTQSISFVTPLPQPPPTVSPPTTSLHFTSAHRCWKKCVCMYLCVTRRSVLSMSLWGSTVRSAAIVQWECVF